MQTRRIAGQALRAAPLAALAFTTDAPAALFDLASLTASPFETWTLFAIAITLVIVLLLWYAVDERPELDRPQPGSAGDTLPDREHPHERRAA